MQHLEVSCSVRRLYRSLGVKGLRIYGGLWYKCVLHLTYRQFYRWERTPVDFSAGQDILEKKSLFPLQRLEPSTVRLVA